MSSVFPVRDKKITARLLKSIGFQMPIELQKNDYIKSISYFKRSVNGENLFFQIKGQEQSAHTPLFLQAGTKPQTEGLKIDRKPSRLFLRPFCKAHGKIKMTWKRNHAVAFKKKQACRLAFLERVTGIEPARPAWKAGILPLNYTRDFSLIILPQLKAVVKFFLHHT